MTTYTVPVPKDQLDAWARFANRVRIEALKIDTAAAGGQRTLVHAELTQLHQDAAAALVSMERAGAATPEHLHEPPEIPLQLLDTPANRRLAMVLRAALEAAQEVDRERGQFDPDEPFDGPVTYPIAEILAKTELECFGPEGKGERG